VWCKIVCVMRSIAVLSQYRFVTHDDSIASHGKNSNIYRSTQVGIHANRKFTNLHDLYCNVGIYFAEFQLNLYVCFSFYRATLY